MLPMTYIGATVPVWRELVGVPDGPLEQCSIADVMSGLAQDPELYFHTNMDQVRCPCLRRPLNG